jgi:HSP20 family molecular chaperone IbpA
LLVVALAALAGGAFAKDCPSDDPGIPANTQASTAMSNPAIGNVIYIDLFADLARMQASMAREFNAFNAMNGLWMPVTIPLPVDFNIPTQASSLQRTKDGYQLQVRVPGFKPEDIHVQLNGQVLTVSAQDSTKDTYKVGNQPEQTMSARSFVQMLTLPGPIEATGFKQSVQNGVLTITIPSARRAPGHA